MRRDTVTNDHSVLRQYSTHMRNVMRRSRVTDDHPGHIGTFDRYRARRAGRRDGRRGIPNPSDAGATPYVEEVHGRIRTAEYAESVELHRTQGRLDGDLVAAARAVVDYRDKVKTGDQAAQAEAQEATPASTAGRGKDGQTDRLPSPRADDPSSLPGSSSTVAAGPPAWVQQKRRARQLSSQFDSAKQRLSELASQWLHELEEHRSRVRLAVNRYEQLLLTYRSAVLERHPHAGTLQESWELPAYQPAEPWMTEDPTPPSRVAEPEVAELLAWALRKADRGSGV